MIGNYLIKCYLFIGFHIWFGIYIFIHLLDLLVILIVLYSKLIVVGNSTIVEAGCVLNQSVDSYSYVKNIKEIYSLKEKQKNEFTNKSEIE